jgi:predicted outer membrane protein
MISGNLLRADPVQTGGLSDSQIMRILVAVDDAGIAAGQLAAKSENSDVKAFALEMVAASTKLNDQIKVLAASVDTNIDHSPTSDGLNLESSDQLTALNSETGKSFDRLYIDDQIKNQAELIQLFDTMLTASAKNPNLAAILAVTRPAVSLRLRHAKSVGKVLQIYYP